MFFRYSTPYLSPNHISNLNSNIRVKWVLELPDYSVQKSTSYVTSNEMKQMIKNLPNKKAPGHDKITNLIKKKLVALMTTLFDFLLRLGYFPVKWKIVTIILIKKKEKVKTNPNSLGQLVF